MEIFEKHLKSVDTEAIRKNLVHRELVRKEDSKPLLIYYNRIPKCGSTFFTSLLNKTAETKQRFVVNNFHHRGLRFSFKNDHEKRRFFNDIEHDVATESNPILYIRHQYFTDFHEAQKKSGHGKLDKSNSVFYMNMLRDPVERFISEYYYKRHGSEITKDIDSLRRVTNTRNVNMTLNECVSTRNAECSSIKQTMTMFFCGQSEDCVENSNRPKSLEKAKSNLLNVYDFIGIHERFEDSIRILEATLPDTMKGLYHNYKSIRGDPGQVTRKKGKVAELSKRLLRKNLKNDVDLYEFSRVLFHERYAKFVEQGLL